MGESITNVYVDENRDFSDIDILKVCPFFFFFFFFWPIVVHWHCSFVSSRADMFQKFRESLVINLNKDETSKDQNLGESRYLAQSIFVADQPAGLSLREMIHEFKYQTLVLFKALLLQPKVGSPTNS